MITSTQNEKVKKWKKLHKSKERNKSGVFLVEGYHLIEEAYKSDWEILEVIVQEGADYPAWCTDRSLTTVSSSVFNHITKTETPQGIAAVVKIKEPSNDISGNAVLLIDAIQDPGNLGTIIRTADAAGFSAVFLGEETVDLFNEKVIRSTQGSLFHLPIMKVNLPEEIMQLKQNGFTVWAAALANSVPLHEMEVDPKIALIVGNEGAGIQEEILRSADKRIKIPIYGKAESLNVSVAAGILMYYISM